MLEYDVILRKEVPFGGPDETARHLGGQILLNPNFLAWMGVFKPNWQSNKTCILSKLLHRF